MNTNPFGLKDNTTYSVKNDVVTEYVKPEPTPQAHPPPMVSSSAWVEELAQSWERRATDEEKSAKEYQWGSLMGALHHGRAKLFRELRAELLSSSTGGSERPREL